MSISAETAAHDAVDPDRLLPGEDPDSEYPEDAAHWALVYSQLLEYKQRLIALTDAAGSVMMEPAAAEVRSTDLKVLRAEEERLKRRQAFWGARVVAT